MTKLAVGQRWTYRTRPEDSASTLIIGKVDKRLMKPSIVHVALENITSPTSDVPIGIGHMPFTEQALTASVGEVVEDRLRRRGSDGRRVCLVEGRGRRQLGRAGRRGSRLDT